MNDTDSSVHGWLLGPVPIILGIWCLVELARMLIKNKRVTRYNISSVYGLSPVVVTLAFFAIGVVARDDLTVNVLAIGSVLSGILSAALHGLLWWSVDAPGLSEWFADGKKLQKNLLVRRLLVSLLLLSCIFGAFSVFGLGSATCTTSRCRSSAILFGSNHGAGALMWIVFASCGVLISMFLASALELARRVPFTLRR